jgi:hypothetical protein
LQSLGGEIYAEGLGHRAVDLQQLDVDEDLTLGFVVGVDDALRDGDLGRGVLDGHGVEIGVLGDLARLQQGAQQRHDRLGLGVAQEEGADDLILVLLPFLPRIRSYQQCELVDDLVEVLGLHHEDVEGLFQRNVADVDRHRLVLVDLVVEDEVDPRCLADGAEDLPHLDLLEVEQDGDVRARVQLGRSEILAAGPLLEHFDFGGSLLGAVQLAHGPLHLAGGVLVVRAEQQGLLELSNGELELAGFGVPPPLDEVLRRRLELGPLQGDRVAGVARIESDGLAVSQDRPVIVLPAHIPLGLVVGLLGGAAGEYNDHQDQRS